MKFRSLGAAAACAGAVVGAGFASGREIMTFFSVYGWHGWWLIGIAVLVMMALCTLCMDAAVQTGASCWSGLFEAQPTWAKGAARFCTQLLLVLTAGGMISASGQMIALLCPHEWAYSLGAAGTLAAAYLLGFGNMRPMSWLSGGLSVLFVMASAMAGFAQPAQLPMLAVEKRAGLIRAAISAAAYASLNMTLAIGVVCRFSQQRKENRRTAWAFGAFMALMMAVSHRLYASHPEWSQEAFPIVRALSGLGRKGFLLSAALVYLSVFTSLTAVMYALRCAAQEQTDSLLLRLGLLFGLPLAVSVVGFTGIVDRFYAPAGLLCLLAVFLPLWRQSRA